ncbi:hypothetical protein HPP92_020533 [Vanilla planifolia]|uniref:Uncharacterized protein n=1 Tax=Vanilla planifolia TaxID=51239 RepID=A0A835PUH4_VANPL|nr:hypothetical protein HPP92_020923 [Vanilla planifolia]KAG0462057.1 hypothetical protein HPP92_020533 [Vanilla planifolia]
MGGTAAGASSSVGRLSSFYTAALRRKNLLVADQLQSQHGDGLVRRLSLFELILLGIGASIGAGILWLLERLGGTLVPASKPIESYIFRELDDQLALHCTCAIWIVIAGVTISFVLAGAACVLNALCYAELASRFPAVVGGAYLYSYTAFNELTAFLVFAQLMLDYHIGAASIARSLASYVVSLLNFFPSLRAFSLAGLGVEAWNCLVESFPLTYWLQYFC